MIPINANDYMNEEKYKTEFRKAYEKSEHFMHLVFKMGELLKDNNKEILFVSLRPPEKGFTLTIHITNIDIYSHSLKPVAIPDKMKRVIINVDNKFNFIEYRIVDNITYMAMNLGKDFAKQLYARDVAIIIDELKGMIAERVIEDGF